MVSFISNTRMRQVVVARSRPVHKRQMPSFFWFPTPVLVLAMLISSSLLWGDSTAHAQDWLGDASYANTVGIGAVTVGETVEAIATWHPDVEIRNFGLGLDVNIPLSGQKTGIEAVVVRSVWYETDDYGLRYGVLEDITYGYGLLMSDYTTRLQGAPILTNKQTGARGYYHFKHQHVRYGFHGMWSQTSLYALRATQQIHPKVVLGQTLVSDRDGVMVTDTSGVVTQFPARTGYGADVGFPLFPGFTPYIEYAAIKNAGSGVGAGVKTRYVQKGLADLHFRAEYRSFGENFVPGFFNAQYETNPVTLTGSPASRGYLATAGASLLENRYSAEASIESYEEGLGAAFAAKAQAVVNKEVSVAAYLDQPTFTGFRNLSFENGAIYTGAVTYKPRNTPGLMVTTYYKRYYDSSQQKVVDTTYTEARFSF